MGGYFSDAFYFSRIRCAYDEAELAIGVPLALGEFGDVLVQQRLAGDGAEALGLEVVAAGVGGAAEQEGAFAVVGQVGLHGVITHEGREGDGVGPVALKGFDGVLGGGGADVAAFGIQNHRHVGRGAAHVLHELFQLVFGAVGVEIGDLGFEGDDQIGCGVHNGGAKVVDFAGFAFNMGGEFGRLGV